MSNPIIPPVPLGDPDDTAVNDTNAGVTREVDGDDVLDRDANDDLVDSADADRLASGADDHA